MIVADAVPQRVTPIIVVSDKFINFCEKENLFTFSQFLKYLQHAPDRSQITHVSIGQGITTEQLEIIQERLNRYNGHEIKIQQRISQRMLPYLVHKRQPRNVMITYPEKIGENEFEAYLAVDENCDELSDHMTGKHLPGTLLIEASRQAAMGFFEMEVYKKHCNYPCRFAIKYMHINFGAFTFPIETKIITRLFDIEWDKKKQSVKTAKAEVSMFQLGQLVSQATMESAIFMQERLECLENRQYNNYCNLLIDECSCVN